MRFTGKSIKNAGWIPFDNLYLHATMQDRVLSFTPLSFGFADGKMGGNLRFDGSASPMHATVDAHFSDLSLARLTPKVGDATRAEDSIHLAQLLEQLDGIGEGMKETALLVHAEGLSHAAAGEILGVSESTISWRIHTMRKHFTRREQFASGSV